MEKPKYLCHYTSIEVLCKLFTTIKRDNFLFHASSVMFMNDGAEYKVANDKCRDGFQEIVMEYELGSPFALCFSDSDSNIPMWSMYANKGKGVCLKFNFEKLENYFEEMKKKDDRVIRFSNCEYQEMVLTEKQKPLSSDNGYPGEEIKNEMMEVAFVKPTCFRHEAEWRLMIWQRCMPDGKHRLLFKEKQDELCPYIEIPIPVNCLETIVLRPNANWQMINATQLLRTNYGGEGCSVPVKTANISLKE